MSTSKKVSQTKKASSRSGSSRASKGSKSMGKEEKPVLVKEQAVEAPKPDGEGNDDLEEVTKKKVRPTIFETHKAKFGNLQKPPLRSLPDLKSLEAGARTPGSNQHVQGERSTFAAQAQRALGKMKQVSEELGL